jgi:tRNA pseudouridine32 synthase/23S rRNA pseudouridine746 synthase
MYHLVDENEDFLVVNKQPEISIHDEDNANDVSTLNKKGLIKQLRIDFNNNAIAPVHRIDKATSGLLLCSKNSQAASVLSQAFQYRQVEKYYLAISENKPLKKQGLITGDMLRTRNGCWKLSKTQVNPAVTQFFSYSLNNINNSSGRLFILKPQTGKTHQLRVALKTINAAILGDSRYGKITKNINVPSYDSNSNSEVFLNSNADLFDRMHLHAYVLRFYFNNIHYCYRVLPADGQFTKELNDYIESTLNQPWTLKWPTFAKSSLDKAK